MKQLIYSLFLLFFFFLSPIYYCFMTVIGSEQRLLAQTYIVVASIVIIIYLFSKNKFSINEIKCFVCLILFGIVYYSTSTFYGYEQKDYWAQFMSWVSLGNTSVVVGMLLTKEAGRSALTKMIKFMPISNVILTLIICQRLLYGQDTENGQFNDEYGLSYQSMSYYLALLFSCNAFYIFRDHNFNSKKIVYRIFFLGLMAIQAVMCLMSGGRGGMVLLVVYCIFWVWYILKKNKIKIFYLIPIGLIMYILFFAAANYFNIWSTSGFERNSNAFSRDSRLDLWVTFIPIFLESGGWGNGIGSNFYTWGFYSHNIIVDFFTEGGIIGFILFSYIYIRIFKNLKHQIVYDNVSLLVLLFFIFSVVLNLFSGYWPTGQFNWMALGYVATYYTTNHSITNKANQSSN